MPLSFAYDTNVRSMLGSIKTVPIPETFPEEKKRAAQLPFITISREPGCGGAGIAEKLVAELNRHQPQEQLWTCWDRGLVERIAADLHVSDRLIDHFEERNRSWLTEFLESLSMADENADDVRLFRRVATTVRSLAMAGRTVLVGRGGVLLTRALANGTHVRLIAPYDNRVSSLMHERNLTHQQAVAELKTLEHNRHVFYKRYWNRDNVHDEDFCAVYNTAMLSEEQIVRSIIALLPPAGSGRSG